jgi:hypothetical protein
MIKINSSKKSNYKFKIHKLQVIESNSFLQIEAVLFKKIPIKIRNKA